MKNFLTFLSLLLINLISAQETDEKLFEFKPEFSLGPLTTFFFGDNYLTKGHINSAIGGVLQLNLVEYYNFKLGASLEKSTIKVSEVSLGGNINKTNLNSAKIIASYKLELKELLSFYPNFSFGGIELKQKSGRKLYGTQSGQVFGFGINSNYRIGKFSSVYANIGYDYLKLNTNTNPAFKSYFNKSNALHFSVGFNFN